MCRYPFGSGGKRVRTRPWYLLVLRPSTIFSRRKFDGRDSGERLSRLFASVNDEFIVSDLNAEACSIVKVSPQFRVIPDGNTVQSAFGVVAEAIRLKAS